MIDDQFGSIRLALTWAWCRSRSAARGVRTTLQISRSPHARAVADITAAAA